MAYDEKLADRVRILLAKQTQEVAEITMFSGICFMVNDKMCAGVQHNHLMVRLNPEIIDQVLEEDGARQMEMKGKPMKSFILVDSNVLNTARKLQYWIGLALDYNPLAKAAKKKKK